MSEIRNYLDYVYGLSRPSGRGGRPGAGGDPALRLAMIRLAGLAKTFELAAGESLHYRPLRPRLTRLSLELKKLAGSAPDAGQAAGAVMRALDGLPLTTPEELAAKPESFLAVPQDAVEGLVSAPTSGSLGPSKRIFSSKNDLESVVKFFQFGMRNVLGASPRATGAGRLRNPPEEPPAIDDPAPFVPDLRRDGVTLLMSGTRPGSVGGLLTEALRRWSTPCLVMGFLPAGRADREKYLAELAKNRTGCLVGLPSQLVRVARTIRRPAGLRSVLLSGECAPPGLVGALQAEWGVEVFVHYGLAEFGLGGAVECGRHTGPHLRDGDMLAEILDENGRRLPPGREGEIVLTSLSREAMPLIRYRTGDLGLVPAGPCPCGSALSRLVVLGRKSDQATLPDGGTLRLADLASALYRIKGLTGFSARYSADPAPELTLQVGVGDPAPGKKKGAADGGRETSGRETGGKTTAELVRKAVGRELGLKLQVKVKVSREGPSPAPGGAKQTLAAGREQDPRLVPASLRGTSDNRDNRDS
ncbi:MAG: hypothetical protein LBO05_11690 [Deltaproteobacteria bacterium]|jgi:phenylacetate-coenzyme A ligase PaaK-like adenylate-forming protein|nr:hypothetical protein [Deltaproteobacteria bacterium]